MTKELADLATDKKEDIAKELEERAKAKEPVPVEIHDETETAPKDDPATPPEAPEKGEAPAEPAPSEKKEPEESALLKRLRTEHKLDHSYKDEEALLKSHASLRRKLSERDPDAALGRALREAGVSPEDLAKLFKENGSEPAKGTDDGQAPEWDPAWDREVRRTTNEDGEVEYRGPPEMVRKVKEYETALDSFRRAPMKTLDKWGLSKLIRQAAQDVVLEQQGHQTFEAYMKDNKDFIEENRDDITALTRQGWKPTHAIEHLKLRKETEGLRTSKTGEDAKKNDLERLAGKATRRAGAAATPIKSARDLANLPLKDAVAQRLAEAGESIPESW